MLKKPVFVAVVVSVILVLYTVLLATGAAFALTGLIYALSPFLMIWLVFTVLRFGKYEGPELEADEEWGYQDKQRSELNVL